MELIMVRPELGKTGDFPQGKLNKDDEGGLMIAISEYKGKIVIDFGVAVKWIGFDKEQARAFANNILEKVNE